MRSQRPYFVSVSGVGMNFESECKLFPLTHPQKRIFLQSVRNPDLTWPVILYMVKFPRAIDFELLSMAINIYIHENEGLRIKLVLDSQDGIAKQCFIEHTDRKWEHLGFSDSDEAEFEEWKGAQARRNFDLYEDALYDFHLIQFPDGKQGFSMRMHHICSDGFTCISLANRVDELYRGIAQGRPPVKGEAAPYREFVTYEQSYLTSPDFVHDKEFWLSENLHELEGYRLAPKRSYADSEGYDSVRYEIPQALLHAMTQWHRDSGLSLFVQFFTALALYVHRVSSLDSFAISLFGHNRTRRDMKTTAGMFVGTYPLRIDILENIPFLELAENISGKLKTIIKAHGKFPFDELVRLTREKHQTEINHLINISIIELYYREGGHYLMELVHQENIQNQLSVFIERYENPEHPSSIRFTFDTRIYRKSDIQNLFGGICSILEKFFLDPSMKVGTLPLISRQQYQKQVHEFNQTFRSFPKDKCMHHLFEDAVLKNPSNTAIECEGRSITYGELNRQSDLLAEKLRHAGVGPEKIVGVCMYKSIETVIAFLAVLKAGGAYVPIDPTLPVERIRFILQDTDSACLIVHQGLAERVRKDYQGKCVVCAENRFTTGDWEETKIHSIGGVSPRNLMYVIYTSGSTGKPKGVMVEHHGFVNLISDQVRRYQLTEKDRFLHFISFSFDASQEHLFRVLCSGSILCLAGGQSNLNEIDIPGLLKSLNITCCAFPASLLEKLDAKEFPEMKVLSSGAEKCSLSLFKKWSKGRRFFNSYGPTETTVLSHISQLDSKETEPHIGKPIANAQAFVLDKYRMPLPIGMEGELYIGGEGVARGYLNQPELTKSVFIPNPFDPSWESRLYRTGDIVYFRNDGNLVFVGRRDKQVKIRGFRIELDEIKEVMLQHSAVKEAVVLVQKSGGRQRLVAFLVTSQGESIDSETLKTYLNGNLPAYEVPDTLVSVDSIPLTTHGKIDEKRLFQNLSSHPLIKRKHAAQSKTERLLKRLWCDLLNVRDIDITENFFYSGGDSLMALEICMTIEKQFGMKITVQQFMQFPTIQSIAAMLDRKKREQGTAVRIRKSETGKGSLIVVHSFKGECNYGSKIARGLDDNLDIYAVSMDEITLNNLKVTSMQDLAAFHVGQMLEQNPVFPLLLCGFSWSGTLAYEMAIEFDKRRIPVELLLIDTKFPDISDLSAGERVKYHSFHFLRAMMYFFKPAALVLGAVTRAGRDRFQFSMDEALLELYLYLKRIKNFVWKGHPSSPTGKQSLRKSLRMLPARPNECPASLKVHYLMTRPDSFLRKILLTDQSARWGKKMARPLTLHKLKGQHIDLIGKNLSITTDCIQNIINCMIESETR